MPLVMREGFGLAPGVHGEFQIRAHSWPVHDEFQSSSLAVSRSFQDPSVRDLAVLFLRLPKTVRFVRSRGARPLRAQGERRGKGVDSLPPRM
jgi:hypothetical protein